jgi:hypothetical protein
MTAAKTVSRSISVVHGLVAGRKDRCRLAGLVTLPPAVGGFGLGVCADRGEAGFLSARKRYFLDLQSQEVCEPLGLPCCQRRGPLLWINEHVLPDIGPE